MTTRIALFTGFVTTVIAANWALSRYGTVPVAPGLEAPAGVYFAGLAFGLRDALHEAGGRTDQDQDFLQVRRQRRRWVLAAIATGSAVSYLIEDAVTIPGGHAPIAVASAAAFALSELADLAVYSRIRERSRAWALAVSNLVGAPIDSALFLWLAFGGLAHFQGQVVGKLLMIAPAVAALWAHRAYRAHRTAVA